MPRTAKTWQPRTGPTEAEFLSQVIQLAQLRGWLAVHFRPALTKRGGWVTAVQGDGRGFPDLLLVRDKVIAAELKVGRGKLTDAQSEWLAAFRAAGVGAYVWWPADWKSIEEILE